MIKAAIIGSLLSLDRKKYLVSACNQGSNANAYSVVTGTTITIDPSSANPYTINMVSSGIFTSAQSSCKLYEIICTGTL